MVAAVLLVAWAGVGVWCVLRLRRVPNWLTLGGVMVGLSAGALTGGSGGLGTAGLGAAAGLGLLLPISVVGLAGPGDMKLAGALGALAGWPAIGWVGLYSVAFALLTALGVAVLAGTFKSLLIWGYTGAELARFGGAWWEHLLGKARGRMPLALFLCAGALVYGLILLVTRP